MATVTHNSKMAEKKIIDEKIGKVKEIVKNVSNNDIMLALYNFDLDVERTIHAFCEGGSQTALGDWEKTTTGGKKRNNKKKSKTAALIDERSNGDGGSLMKGTESISSISSITCSTGYSNQTALPAVSNNKSLVNGGNSFVNKNVLPDETKGQDFGVKHVNGVLETDQNGHQQVSSLNNIINADIKVSTNGEAITNAPDFDDNMAHLKQYKSTFDAEILTAQTNIQQCFKELHDALSLREQQLFAELSDCKRDGQTYFTTRENVLRKVYNNNKQKPLAIDLETFNLAKTEDLETAFTTRFIFENSSLVESIQKHGKVIPVKLPSSVVVSTGCNNCEENKNMANKALHTSEIVDPVPSITQNPPTRRSNSPSSLVSSADSGLGGQISPLNQEKRPIAEVQENGITLKSDSISADQLAEIQRNIVESLKAKGIDPSVLIDINAATTTAHRRRPQSHQRSPGRAQKNDAAREKNNRNENGSNNNGKKQQRQPQQQHKK